MKGLSARSLALLALASLVFAITAASGSAAGPGRGHILGVVPHSAPRATGIRAAVPATLTFDASYETLVNRYFTDVEQDSGGGSNVYSVATQYSDGSGAVEYQSTFGGSYVDHDPLPANGCNDGVDGYCLTDKQLAKEIQSVLTAKGWHGGLDHMFFLMTPAGVGSCFDGVHNDCTTNFFCAYHNFFVDSQVEDVIYAYEPYEGPSALCTDLDQGLPNDPDADTTINTISHEHNEAITDPLTDPTSSGGPPTTAARSGTSAFMATGPRRGRGPPRTTR